MPIHFNNRDILSQIAGLSSAIIVPCNMCPAITVAVRENRPFIQFFRRFLKSAPFEQYIKALQSQLSDRGVKTRVFRSNFIHQWFMCMWTSGQRKKLQKHAKSFDALIVLGCDSATETVRDLVNLTETKVIEGMEVSGIMNAKLKFHLPCNISFENCEVIPINRQKKDEVITV